MVTGCGTSHRAMKGSSGQIQNPQTNDFLGWGEVAQTADGIRLTMSTDDIFDQGTANLSPFGFKKIDSIAIVILKHPKDFVAIHVFTDSGADESYGANLELSRKQANAIRDEFIKKDISLSSVTAVGKGSAQPLASNDTDGNKAQNRRIEFEITTQSPDR